MLRMVLLGLLIPLGVGVVCTENPIQVYRMIESAKLAR
jgi:hypothetical protein